MYLSSQSFYFAHPYGPTGNQHQFFDVDSSWVPTLGDGFTQATARVHLIQMDPFEDALPHPTPRVQLNAMNLLGDVWPYNIVEHAKTYEPDMNMIPWLPPVHDTLTQEMPGLPSNDGTLFVEERQLWEESAVPACYPSSSASIPRTEAGISPDHPSYCADYNDLGQIPEFLKSALEKLPDAMQTDNYLPTRETSVPEKVKLAAQARGRPSSTISSAQRVEASARSNERQQPRTETRRKMGRPPAGVAPYHSRSSLAANMNLQPTIPTPMPRVNPSQRPNNAIAAPVSPVTSKLGRPTSSSLSTKTPSPTQFTVKRFVNWPKSSQGQKRLREDEPTTERDVKRSKKESHQSPAILAWAFEDGKSEKSIFRNTFGPPRM